MFTRFWKWFVGAFAILGALWIAFKVAGNQNKKLTISQQRESKRLEQDIAVAVQEKTRLQEEHRKLQQKENKLDKKAKQLEVKLVKEKEKIDKAAATATASEAIGILNAVLRGERLCLDDTVGRDEEAEPSGSCS